MKSNNNKSIGRTGSLRFQKKANARQSMYDDKIKQKIYYIEMKPIEKISKQNESNR